MAKQEILVVQQNNNGESKIKGIQDIGGQEFEIKTWEIDSALPEVIDDASEYLPKEIEADLVLDYLNHPDLSQDLADLCKSLQVPIVASGKKIENNWVYTPPVCCALSKNVGCGHYSSYFGFPEFEVQLKDGVIEQIKVKRGAPCGATWKAIQGLTGLNPEDAVQKIGLDIQFFCTANPAGWDPIYEKSPVHLAGKLHSSALQSAI